MRALHLHHDANSLPGLIGEVLADRDIETVTHQVCEIPGSPIGSPEFPDPEEFDLIVVYGSRWSVYDDDVAHWVVPELDLLRRADGAGVPVLGLCFGGQMLSAAHGGLVAAADRPEIGWHRVQSHVPDIEPGPWLQWHFDIFTVPEGADELAASPSGPQAFRLRRNLALQFHPEADRDVIEAWFADDIDQIQAFEVDPDELLVQADRERPAARARAERLVRTLLD
jgi:GMP synthase-like glutamine amidotransferase